MRIAEWKHYTYDDLRAILSEDEVERLNSLSLEDTRTQIINDCMDLLAGMWRGAIASKGYAMDVRDCYMPPEYAYWYLVHCRHAVWTRFPNSGQIALDDPRKDEYEQALETLKNPTIATSTPDYSDDPVLSGDESLNDTTDAAIFVPPMRIWPSLPYRLPGTEISSEAITTRNIMDTEYPVTPPNTEE